jgi:hypothetical protein
MSEKELQTKELQTKKLQTNESDADNANDATDSTLTADVLASTSILPTWCDRACRKHVRRELRGKNCDLEEVRWSGLLDQLEMIASYNEMQRLQMRIQEYRSNRGCRARRCSNCSLWLYPAMADQIECTFSPAKYSMLQTSLCCRCHSYLCNCRVSLPMHVFGD